MKTFLTVLSTLGMTFSSSITGVQNFNQTKVIEPKDNFWTINWFYHKEQNLSFYNGDDCSKDAFHYTRRVYFYFERRLLREPVDVRSWRPLDQNRSAVTKATYCSDLWPIPDKQFYGIPWDENRIHPSNFSIFHQEDPCFLIGVLPVPDWEKVLAWSTIQLQTAVADSHYWYWVSQWIGISVFERMPGLYYASVFGFHNFHEWMGSALINLGNGIKLYF